MLGGNVCGRKLYGNDVGVVVVAARYCVATKTKSRPLHFLSSSQAAFILLPCFFPLLYAQKTLGRPSPRPERTGQMSRQTDTIMNSDSRERRWKVRWTLFECACAVFGDGTAGKWRLSKWENSPISWNIRDSGNVIERIALASSENSERTHTGCSTIHNGINSMQEVTDTIWNVSTGVACSIIEFRSMKITITLRVHVHGGIMNNDCTLKSYILTPYAVTNWFNRRSHICQSFALAIDSIENGLNHCCATDEAKSFCLKCRLSDAILLNICCCLMLRLPVVIWIVRFRLQTVYLDMRSRKLTAQCEFGPAAPECGVFDKEQKNLPGGNIENVRWSRAKCLSRWQTWSSSQPLDKVISCMQQQWANSLELAGYWPIAISRHWSLSYVTRVCCFCVLQQQRVDVGGRLRAEMCVCVCEDLGGRHSTIQFIKRPCVQCLL